MHTIRFRPQLEEEQQSLARGLIEAVLRAADPDAALTRHFDHAAHTRPTHILAFGKASVPMASAAIRCLGPRFARATVLAPPALSARSSFKSKLVDLLPADHPLPTQRNIDAAARLDEHARSIPADHDAIVLISGGGSAMLCSPKPRVTLDQIIETTDALLRSGASIAEINTQRAELETLKGGGLARALSHTRQIWAYVLSDVIGDDPAVIASGPLVDGHPPAIEHTIIAGNDTAVDAAQAWCAHQRIRCLPARRGVTGESSGAGRELARELMGSDAAGPTAACLGGEPTVDARDSSGTGGPALELAVAGAIELAGAPFRWTICTLTTDGVDGPTDAAGAIISSEMLGSPAAAREAGDALVAHDTLPLCDRIGATLRTGPTGTNVNDIAIAIRWGENS